MQRKEEWKEKKRDRYIKEKGKTGKSQSVCMYGMGKDLYFAGSIAPIFITFISHHKKRKFKRE